MKSEYQSLNQKAVLIDEAQTPLVADFSRDGVDLHLTWSSGHEVVVKDYFSTHNPPPIRTAEGIFLGSELVAKLAGPGPQAQAGNSLSDESPIGELTSSSGQVTVQHKDGASEDLVEGSPVYKGDVIKTGNDGAFELLFIDKTQVSMGENGRVVLDDLVYNASGSSNSFGMSLLQGAFSVVTGLIGKESPEAVSITTPVGTIGIRGTSWAGKILAIGEETFFTLFSGAIVFANEAGSQLLNLINQTIVVTSYSSIPSAPFILNDDRLLEIYGRTLGQIDSKYKDDDDDDGFDPEAISPEAGGRFAGGSGGGAGFNGFNGDQSLLGISLGELLGSGDLLNATGFGLGEVGTFDEDALLAAEGLPSAGVKSITATGESVLGPGGFFVNIALDAPALADTIVFYSVVRDGAEQEGVGADDLSFVGDGQIVIPEGEVEGSVFIAILEDEVIEGIEVFRFELTGAENAEILPLFNGALLIIEDNDIGSVSLQPISGALLAGSQILTDEGTSVEFKVVLDKALGAGEELSVDYVFSGTAVAGEDYLEAVVKTVTFSGGANGLLPGSEIIVSIPIVDDAIFEGDESFSVSLLNASANASIDPSNDEVSIKILDNEIPLMVGDEGEVAEFDEESPQLENQDLELEGGSGQLASLTFNSDQSDFNALGLTAGGIPIILIGLGSAEIIGLAGSQEIFKASLLENGSYVAELIGPVDHLNGDLIEIPLAITLVDANGSSAETKVILNVSDDMPEAVNDFAVVVEGTAVQGDVIKGGVGQDEVGLDGALITGVTLDEDEGPDAVLNDDGDYVIRGTYGVLVLSMTGEFTYNADLGLDNESQLTDTFIYQLEDFDGDQSLATLSIDLNDGPNPVIISIENGFVDEEGLNTSGGIDPLVIFTGKILVDFNGDEPGSIALDLSQLPEVSSFGYPIDYSLSEDMHRVEAFGIFNNSPFELFTLNLEELPDGTGFTYEFELKEYVDNGGPEDAPFNFNFGFEVVDQDGSKATGDFTVTVINDGLFNTDSLGGEQDGGSSLDNVDIFVVDGELSGALAISGFEIDADFVDISQVFDYLGIAIDQRSEGVNWGMEVVDGNAGLAIPLAGLTLSFADFAAPSTGELDDLAARVLAGDVS